MPDNVEAPTHSHHCENVNISLQLSPIVRMDLSSHNNASLPGTPVAGIGSTLLREQEITPCDYYQITDGNGDAMATDTLSSDNRECILFNSPETTSSDREGTLEETEEERRKRETDESEALARQLMAEEAMASYALSTEYLRANSDQFSSEDLAALQAAMAEEDPENNLEEVDGDDDDFDGDDSDSGEFSYDALLRLGERIGDVKGERWALVAREKISELATVVWTPSMAEGKEENHTAVKCQVCQFPYDDGDELRALPCEHYFHKECIDSWLETKDTCALCRKSIVPDN